MIRTLQCIDHKNIPVVTASADLKRGAIVTKTVDNKVDNASAAGFGFVDITPNYDGINAVVIPSDGDFENIESGALCLYIPVHSGERYATSEVVASGLTKGDMLTFGASDNVGKLVEVESGKTGEFVYGGAYDDPTGIKMYIVEKL